MPIRKAEAKSASDARQLRRRDRGTAPPLRPAHAIAEAHRRIYRRAFAGGGVLDCRSDGRAARRQSLDHRALHLSSRPQRVPGSAGADARTGARPALAHRRSHQRRPGRRSSGRHELRRLAQPRLAKSASHHIRSRRRRVRPRGQYSLPLASRLRGRRILDLSGRALFRAGARSSAQRDFAARLQ